MPALPHSALHAADGAVFEEDGPLPDRYGSGADAVAREWQAARESVALVDVSDREVLVVTGPTRQKFLHGMLSHEVESLRDGEGRLAALMDVKGHLLALMRVLALADAVWLEVPPQRRGAVHRRLDHYRVAAPVRFAPRPAALFGMLGPDAADTLEAAAGIPARALAPEGHAAASIAGHAVRVARAGDLPAAGFVVHVEPESAEPVWRALRGAGARPLGRQALDVLRVEDGRPWYGPDVTDAHLLHETGLLREYHSPAKGCYVGQEVVARLEGRGGHVNKALRGLRLSAPAPAGTAVLADGREVGRLTTSGVSPALGPIAMAWVQRGHFQPGTVVAVAGGAATVAGLPLRRPGEVARA